MHIIIIGGGLVASNLIKLVSDNPGRNDRITLIDKSVAVCERLANLYEIDVFNGDGTNAPILEAAGCAKADLFLALTGRDEDNLIACQLARKVFRVHSPICRVNNPKNIAVIQKLGIYNTFSSSMLLAKVLNQEIEHSGLYVVYDIPGNSKAIVEFSLRPDASVAGQALKDCDLPRGSRVVLVTHRDGGVELAQGDTVLYPHDRVMMVCDHDDFTAIQESLVENRLPEGEAQKRANAIHGLEI